MIEYLAGQNKITYEGLIYLNNKLNNIEKDLEEEIIGVNCIGAPIFNQYGEVIACVWMSGPKGRMPLERFPELAEQVCKCARSISEKWDTGLIVFNL